MPRASPAVALWSLAAALVAPLAAPLPAGPQEEERGVAAFDERVSVSWVLVPVVVRARQGHVQGLDRDDFRLFIDGRRTAVDELDLGEDVPLAVVYLQDLSGSMANAGKLEASRRAFQTLLERFGDGDQAALATFAGDRLRIEVPFTGERAALAEAADLWEGYGTTAIHDAVSLLPEISEEGRSGRRVAILVTDGQDNASAVEPEEAVSIVRRARLPVYVLGLTAGRGSAGSQDDGYRYGDLLRSLAERTGGRYFEAASGEEAAEAVAGLVEDLRRRYVLAVATAGEGPRAYREIRVEAALPYRHTLTYRRGYHGTAPIAWHGD